MTQADNVSIRRILRNVGITSGEIVKSLPITCKTVGEPRYYRSPEEKDEFRLNSRRLNGDWKEYANLL
jgi:DNA mismatch repair protein MutH